MRNNSFYIPTFLVLTVITGVFAQKSNDTIYIYETIEVYDTIFVNDTVYRNIEIDKLDAIKAQHSILQLDTTNNKAILLLISNNKTATIPINSIIYNENIKTYDDMKKFSFLGVMLIAAQSMLFAQSDYGVSIGIGTWWAKCNNSTINGYDVSTTEYSPTFNLGFYFKQNFKSNIFLRSELNYEYLSSNYSYKSFYEGPPPYDLILKDVEYTDQYNTFYVGSIGDSESASDYHQISIPLVIGYNVGKIAPYTGIEYGYRFSEKWLNEQFHCFGLKAGAKYGIGQKLSIGIDYYYGLTNDYEAKGYLMNTSESLEVLETYDFNWKSRKLTLSLSYNFADLFKNRVSAIKD